MHKVLVFGGNGQLGQSMEKMKADNIELICLSSKECDITEYTQVSVAVDWYKPDVIVNCAAYTNVEQAESEGMGRCYHVNQGGTIVVCSVAEEQSIPVIQISSDYVFNGQASEDYTPDSKPSPVNLYGRTKYCSERVCLESNPNNIVIRTSWVYSEFGKNFAKTILSRYKEGQKDFIVVDDQLGKPTYAPDLAMAIYSIILKGVETYKGIYHYAGDTLMSWKDFTEMLLSAYTDVSVKGIKTKDQKTAVKRPLYSGLAVSKELIEASSVKNGVKQVVGLLK